MEHITDLRPAIVAGLQRRGWSAGQLARACVPPLAETTVRAYLLEQPASDTSCRRALAMAAALGIRVIAVMPPDGGA